MKPIHPKRFVFALLLVASSAFPFLAATEPPQTRRPNIVWIFSDDHATQAIGAYGGRLQALNPTPNIDRLAAEGMRFDRSYVENSICSPSRATLLTGKLSHKHGVRFIEGVDFDWRQFLFPEALRQAGYRTALIGKIHIKGNPRGFDHWEVLGGQGTYRNPVLRSESGQEKHRGYVSDIITDRSTG
jgi:arylsulfatase A-like enzyme